MGAPIGMSGGVQLAMSKRQMMSILMRNGHLIVQGNETPDELREALRNLRTHTIVRCHRPRLGTPIEVLVPDIRAIELKSTRIRNAHTVVDRKERV